MRRINCVVFFPTQKLNITGNYSVRWEIAAISDLWADSRAIAEALILLHIIQNILKNHNYQDLGEQATENFVRLAVYTQNRRVLSLDRV